MTESFSRKENVNLQHLLYNPFRKVILTEFIEVVYIVESLHCICGGEVLSAGHARDRRCWHGLKGAILLPHVPNGVSLPLAFTARFTLEVVGKGPRIH